MRGSNWLIAVGAAGVFAVAGCGGSGTFKPFQVSVDLAGNSISFAAFQNGAGAWKPITAGADGKLHATVTSSNGTFGIACVQTNPTTVWAWQGTLAEATSFALPPPSPTPSQMTIAGAVSDLGAGQALNITASDGDDQIPANGPYAFTTDQATPWDAYAVLLNGATPVTASMRRGLAATATTQNYDVTAADFLPVIPLTMAITPAAGTTSTLGYVYLDTPNDTQIQLGSSFNASFPFYAPATSEQSPSDAYFYYAQSSSATDAFSTSYVVKKLPVNFALSGPTLPGPVTVTTASTTTNNLLQASWTPDASAKLFYFTFNSADGSVPYNIYVTARWLGTSSTKTYTSPDLSGVSGWSSAINPGASLGPWSYEAIASSLPLSELLVSPANVPDGTSYTYWDDDGSDSPSIRLNPSRPRPTLLTSHNLFPRRSVNGVAKIRQ